MKKEKSMEDMIRKFDYTAKKHRILLQLYCVFFFICIFYAWYYFGAINAAPFIFLLAAAGEVMEKIFNRIENNIDKKIGRLAEKNE